MATNLAQQKDPPGERSPSGHTWFRRRAVDILAQVGSVGENPAVLQMLETIINDEETPESLKCAAVKAIGDLDYNGASGNALALSENLANYAVKSVVMEDERLRNEAEAIAAKASNEGEFSDPFDGFDEPDEGGDEGMDSGYGDGGEGFDGGLAQQQTAASPDQERIDRSRRLLKHKLNCTLYGLRGPEIQKRLGMTIEPKPVRGAIMLAAADDEDTQKKLDEIIQAVTKMLAATDPPTKEEPFGSVDDLMKSVKTELALLESLLPKAQAEKAGAEEAGDVPGGGDDVPGGGDDLPGGGEDDVPGGE